jgi:hypothetical protein
MPRDGNNAAEIAPKAERILSRERARMAERTSSPERASRTDSDRRLERASGKRELLSQGASLGPG